MPEQKTTELEVEKQAGTETLETESDGETKQPESTEDDSPYAKQLSELKQQKEAAEAELEKQKKIIENKNRAIEASKAKLKESAVDEDALAERLLARLEEKNVQKDVQSKISALTGDKTEQEVILHHYQNSLSATLSHEARLKAAVALAEQDKVWEQRRNKAIEEQREDFITGFAGSSLRGETQPSRQNDPMLSQAEALLRNINPEAIKHLK